MDFFTLVGLNACLYFLFYFVCLWFLDCDLQLAFFEKFGKNLVKLRGKVVWIIGASTEMGRMMALQTARRQGKLVLSSDSGSLEELKRIKAMCLQINPFMTSRDVFILGLDVEDTNTHRRVFTAVLRHFGRVDVLIIIADRWETGTWEDTSQTTDRLLFHSNVFGVVSLSRLAVRYFRSKKKGRLAVTSSIAGMIGVPYSSSYTATKHALHGYFESLRFEKVGENIKATLLCLGSSNLSQERSRESKEKFLDPEARKRKKMTAERCAHLCLTAIVNDLDEAWMAVFPILPLIYAIKYFPNLTKSLLKYLKSKEVGTSK